MQYIVISRHDSTTLGPFPDEQSAIDWAKGKKWVQGYFVRMLHPVSL